MAVRLQQDAKKASPMQQSLRQTRHNYHGLDGRRCRCCRWFGASGSAAWYSVGLQHTAVGGAHAADTSGDGGSGATDCDPSNAACAHVNCLRQAPDCCSANSPTPSAYIPPSYYVSCDEEVHPAASDAGDHPATSCAHIRAPPGAHPPRHHIAAAGPDHRASGQNRSAKHLPKCLSICSATLHHQHDGGSTSAASASSPGRWTRTTRLASTKVQTLTPLLVQKQKY